MGGYFRISKIKYCDKFFEIHEKREKNNKNKMAKIPWRNLNKPMNSLRKGPKMPKTTVKFPER